MRRLLILALGVALTALCGTSASDSDVSLNPSAERHGRCFGKASDVSSENNTGQSRLPRGDDSGGDFSALDPDHRCGVGHQPRRGSDQRGARPIRSRSMAARCFLRARRSQASSRRPMAPVASRGGLRLRFSLPR